MQSDEAGEGGQYSRGYRRAALLLLTLVYVFNFVDRQVLNILAESIKQELALSDTQLGIVTGLAFALFYSLLGIPIARFAERADRPRLIAIAISVWSAFTILCGFAGSFAQMLICRLGVGVGEAGGVPPSHSLIAEFSPKARRAVALAIFSTGLPLGSFIGLGFGGILGDLVGWRMTFVLAGVPGLLIALAVLLVLKEPRRSGEKVVAEGREAFLPSLKAFLSKRTYRWTVAGGTLQAIVIYGTGAFLAPFFLRAHGPELSALAAAAGLKANGFLGLVFGVTVGLAGAAGTFMGGWLSDRASRESLRSYVTVPAIAAWLSIPAFLLVLTAGSAIPGFLFLSIGNAMINAYLGPMHATCQGVAGASRRATVSAVTLVIINLFGLGIGPPLVGFLSDLGQSAYQLESKDALRNALMVISCVSLLAGFAFWQARRTIDVETIS